MISDFFDHPLVIEFTLTDVDPALIALITGVDMPEFREGQRVRSTQIIEGTVVMAPKIMERGTYPTLKDDNGDLWPLYDLTRTYEILAEPMPPAPAEHSIMMDRLDCTWRMRTCGMAERLGVGDTALEMTWVGAWKDFGPFTVLREGRG